MADSLPEAIQQAIRLMAHASDYVWDQFFASEDDSQEEADLCDATDIFDRLRRQLDDELGEFLREQSAMAAARGEADSGN